MQRLDRRQTWRVRWCLAGAACYGAAQGLLAAAAAAIRRMTGAGPAASILLSGAASLMNLTLPLAVLLVFSPLQPAALRLRGFRLSQLNFYLPLYLGAGIALNYASLLFRPLDSAGPAKLPGGAGPVLAVLVTSCLIPALFEELFFRGALMGLLLPCGSRIAIFGSAVFFAVFHSQPSQMFVAFFTGLFFGWTAQRTGSILPGMALHFANNLAAIAQTGLEQFAPSLAAGAETFYLVFFGGLAILILLRCHWHGHLPDGYEMEEGPPLPALLWEPLFPLFAAGCAAARLFL